MNADLSNFIWELCLLPHKVKDKDKDKFQACLLGMEDMNAREFFTIFNIRPGMQEHNCATCKWFMSGRCYHPFMPIKMISGIFSTAMGVHNYNELSKVTGGSKITEDSVENQGVDTDNVCNEWTDQRILNLGYNGVSIFINELLDNNLRSLIYNEESYWNSINYYINIGFGDQDSEECRKFFKNWMFEVRDEFLKIYQEKYDFNKLEDHNKKVAEYKNQLRFELFTFWLRRPNFHDPLERYVK